MHIRISNHPQYSSVWSRREYLYEVMTQYGAGYSTLPYELWGSTLFHRLRSDVYCFPKLQELQFFKMYQGVLRGAMP